MRYATFLLAFLMAFGAAQANAACIAEYKAKRDNPLRLDYGTMSIPDSACTKSGARAIVQAELAKRGWTLLSIVSVSAGG